MFSQSEKKLIESSQVQICDLSQEKSNGSRKVGSYTVNFYSITADVQKKTTGEDPIGPRADAIARSSISLSQTQQMYGETRGLPNAWQSTH